MFHSGLPRSEGEVGSSRSTSGAGDGTPAVVNTRALRRDLPSVVLPVDPDIKLSLVKPEWASARSTPPLAPFARRRERAEPGLVKSCSRRDPHSSRVPPPDWNCRDFGSATGLTYVNQSRRRLGTIRVIGERRGKKWFPVRTGVVG